ncbi:MAG: ABC transporter ATP-binding protein [Rhizobiaceae bacterium]
MTKTDTATAETQLAARWGEPNTAGVSIPHELTFENVSYDIDDAAILDDVSLVAPSGSVTCLLGPSGSGKTSLLRIAAGMLRQTGGRVLLDSREVCSETTFVPPEKRGIGLVFQDYALFPHLSIRDNVLFGLRHLPRDARKAQATKMLTRVGLADRGSDFPHNLSGGEQQRVALARALAPRPGVLLMDEPFSGLDSRLRDMMRNETLGILRETRATSVIVTHDPEEALRMGDQIALLHEGRLEQTGSGRELYYQPKSLFAAGFFSELNIFEGRIKDNFVETPLGTIASGNGFANGASVLAVVRVGAVQVGKSVPGAVIGRVLSAHFSGEHDHLQVGISGYDTPVNVRLPVGILTDGQLNGSDEVTLSVEKQGAFVFSAG